MTIHGAGTARCPQPATRAGWREAGARRDNRPMNAQIQHWGEGLRLLVEWLATGAFALSGVLEAARKRLDAVGVCVVAFLAAFGGGTLRDLLLDHRPFFWVAHVEVLWAVLALAVGAMLWMRRGHIAPTERAIQWPDALGLGLFTAAGTHRALVEGMPALVAVLMGVLTAVFGGVLRDMVCNEIPRSATTGRTRCSPSPAAGCTWPCGPPARRAGRRCWAAWCWRLACGPWRCGGTGGCRRGRPEG